MTFFAPSANRTIIRTRPAPPGLSNLELCHHLIKQLFLSIWAKDTQFDNNAAGHFVSTLSPITRLTKIGVYTLSSSQKNDGSQKQKFRRTKQDDYYTYENNLGCGCSLSRATFTAREIGTARRVCVYSITCLSWPQYWPQSVQIIESGAAHLTRWANNVEHGTNRSSSSTGNSFDRLHHHYQWRRAQANTLHKVTPKLWKINRLNICAFWLIWSVGNERRWSRWVEQCVCVCVMKKGPETDQLDWIWPKQN